MNKSKRGKVYAVEFASGLVKIGSTARLENRMYSLQRENGIITHLYVSDEVSDCVRAERKAQMGLLPVKGNEFFDISFGQAVERIILATGKEQYRRKALKRRDIIKMMGRLATPKEINEQMLTDLMTLMELFRPLNSAD